LLAQKLGGKELKRSGLRLLLSPLVLPHSQCFIRHSQFLSKVRFISAKELRMTNEALRMGVK
jgi:hypothetical protein